MAITYNNNTAQNVEYNSNNVDVVTYNGVQVFPEVPRCTFTYNAYSKSYFTYNGIKYENDGTLTVPYGAEITFTAEAVGQPHEISLNGTKVKEDTDGYYNISYTLTVNSPTMRMGVNRTDSSINITTGA